MHDFGMIQIHTLPIATRFNIWQINLKNFYDSDASVNAL